MYLVSAIIIIFSSCLSKYCKLTLQTIMVRIIFYIQCRFDFVYITRLPTLILHLHNNNFNKQKLICNHVYFTFHREYFIKYYLNKQILQYFYVTILSKNEWTNKYSLLSK